MMYSQNLILENHFMNVLEVGAENLANLKLKGVLHSFSWGNDFTQNICVMA